MSFLNHFYLHAALYAAVLTVISMPIATYLVYRKVRENIPVSEEAPKEETNKVG